MSRFQGPWATSLLIAFIATFVVSLVASSAQAADAVKNELQATDAQNAEALEKTQALLRNRDERNKAINAAPDSQSNHSELEKLVGAGANTDAVYDLTADILANIVGDAKGDPLAMQQRMMDAQKNPQAFLNSLSPEQRARIKAMADKIESNRGPSSKP
jgi:hypothetical protein